MMDDIRDQIERLKYQVRMLGETIDREDYPIHKLIISMDWGEEELEKANDIFEKYSEKLDQGEALISGAFEKDWKDQFGISYQGLKTIINAFYRNHQWTDVCEAYATQHDVVEFHGIRKHALRERKDFAQTVRGEIDDVKRKLQF